MVFSGSLNFENLREEKIWQLVKIDPISKKPFCAVCNKSFANKKITFEHIKSIYVKRKDVPCQYCASLFTTITLKNNHIHKVHAKEHKLTKLLNA